MKKKIQKIYQDNGFGFPMTLLNVPLIQVRGEWIPFVNQKELQSLVTQALVVKPARLTGNEVRFIRQFTQMTLEQFAERFDVTHPAVLKWEKTKNAITGMAWTTEKDIRLFALNALNPRAQQFMAAYQRLVEVAEEVATPIKIDFVNMIA
jgi:hypothetical protein